MVCASETLPFVGSACGPQPLVVGGMRNLRTTWHTGLSDDQSGGDVSLTLEMKLPLSEQRLNGTP